MCRPKFRIGLVDNPRVGNDPLPVERAERIALWGRALAGFLRDWRCTRGRASKPFGDDLSYMLVAGLAVSKMRVEEHLLLRRRRIDQPIPSLDERFSIRRDDPRAPGHDAGAVV